MYVAIIKVCVWGGSYDSPTHYTESVYEQRLVMEPTKTKLYGKLRKEYNLTPLEISKVVREVPHDGMDIAIEEFSHSHMHWLWNEENDGRYR